MERFFIVTPIGFEAEAESELRECWPDLLAADSRPHTLPLPDIERRKGGVEIQTDLFAAVQLNFFLKTASRILWRLDSFRVRDFPKLHARLKRIDVAARLGTKRFSVKAAASGSRLGHEKRLEETALSAWGAEPGGDSDPAVYLRLHGDECTVSLDTTGEHLHRRGLNLHRGEAPVRETVAAFCLRKLVGDLSAAELQEVTLIDPMCGSGTFLTEAMSLWGGHFQREFRFQSFHGLPKLFKQPRFSANYKSLPPPPFPRVRGFDRDQKVIEAARLNLARTSELFPGSEASVAVADLFASVPSPVDHPWIVSNPPYGERIEGEAPQKILDHLVDVWKPERVGLLWTPTAHASLRWPKGAKRVSESRLKNGGLEVLFVVADIKN